MTHTTSNCSVLNEIGSNKLKHAPPCSLLVTSTLPLCELATELTTAKPRPVPWLFVVKKGSNIFSDSAKSTPGPLSDTEILTLSDSSSRAALNVMCAFCQSLEYCCELSFEWHWRALFYYLKSQCLVLVNLLQAHCYSSPPWHLHPLSLH